MANIDGALAGFAYTILDEDPLLGAVLQNIHVATSQQRKGVGKRLVRAVAKTVAERRPDSGLHVWVREQNTSAAAFYEALGGRPGATKRGGPFADGSYATVRCFVWANPRSDVVAAHPE